MQSHASFGPSGVTEGSSSFKRIKAGSFAKNAQEDEECEFTVLVILNEVKDLAREVLLDLSPLNSF